MMPPLVASPSTEKLPARSDSLWGRLPSDIDFWSALFVIPLDAALVALAFISAFWLRFRFPLMARLLMGESTPWAYYKEVLPAVTLLWCLIFIKDNLFKQVCVPTGEQMEKIFSACLQAMLTTLAFSFLLRRFMDSRFIILAMLPLAALFVFIGHLLADALMHLLTAHTPMCKRLLVVGDGKLVDFLKKRAQSDHYQKLQFLPPLANADILKFVMDHQIHEVIVTQMLGNKQDLIQLAETLDASDITLRIVPNLLESHMGELQIDLAMGLPMMRLRHISLSGTHFAIKRIVDVLFCCGVFIIGSIPLALIALLIKLDSRGPVFYKQTRVGYKGNLFQLYKFRTMVQDAEKLLDSIRSQNERAGSVFKMRNDPRVTRVGRWLRRFSLDEVPQFINVIKGEMSVIGPRPPLPKEVAEYPPIAKKRLNVLPGLTGLWQVNGRADLDFDQMVVLDLYYIEHWSLGLDMTIILKTPYAMLSARGAY